MWLKPSVAGNDNNEYIYFSSPHAIPDASRGLVGLWHLDNSTQDSSGQGKHGTAVGGTNCAPTVTGKFGTACSFDGVNDNISLSQVIPIANKNYTVSAWVNKANNTPNHAILDGLWFSLQFRKSTIVMFHVNETGWKSFTLNVGTVPENEWHYISVVHDYNTGWSIYFDGVFKGVSGKVGYYSTYTPNSIGSALGSNDRGGQWLNGTVDEVAIWNRSLSAQEIKEQALGLSLYKNTTNMLNFHVGNETLGYSTTSWSANDWHHIAGTWSTSGANLYVDGSLQTTKTSISLPNNFTYNAYIGNDAWQHNATNGTIDELSIWNRTLTATEIREHYDRALLNGTYYSDIIDLGSIMNISTISWQEYCTAENCSLGNISIGEAIGSGRNGEEDLTGLVGLWHMDNSTQDSSGLGHATTSGNVSGLGKANCSTAVSGKFGTACSFGTTDADIINISMGSSLLNNSGSLEMWLKPSVAGNDNAEYIYFSSPHAVPDTSQGLVGLWHLDNSTQDSSSLGNHGTSVGGTNCAPTVAGKFGTACSFDGVDDYVSLPSSIYQKFANTDNFTFSVWAIGYTSYPFTFTGDNAQHQPKIEIAKNAMTVRASGGTQNIVSYTAADSISWHLYTLTWVSSTNTISAYVDGILKGSDNTNSLTFAKTDFGLGSIGRLRVSSSWNGTIDEVAIWNRSLSAQEIKEQAWGLSLYKNTTNMLNFHIGNETLGYATSSWSANDWHHITGTWSTSGANLYVDGSMQSSKSSIALPNNFIDNAYIGNDEWQHNATNGTIDEVGVWNRTLNSNEIRNNYLRGASNRRIQTRFGNYLRNQQPVLLFDDFDAYANGTNPTGWSEQVDSQWVVDSGSYMLTNTVGWNNYAWTTKFNASAFLAEATITTVLDGSGVSGFSIGVVNKSGGGYNCLFEDTGTLILRNGTDWNFTRSTNITNTTVSFGYGTRYQIKLLKNGTSVQCKLWPSYQAEPAWTLTATDPMNIDVDNLMLG